MLWTQLPTPHAVICRHEIPCAKILRPSHLTHSVSDTENVSCGLSNIFGVHDPVLAFALPPSEAMPHRRPSVAAAAAAAAAAFSCLLRARSRAWSCSDMTFGMQPQSHLSGCVPLLTPFAASLKSESRAKPRSIRACRLLHERREFA